MPVEMLTYADLAERLTVSPEAARALARRLQLPRQRGNDGKARVSIDISEVQHKPLSARSPAGHQADFAMLTAKIVELEDELAQLELVAASHRADYERERDRADRLVTEMLKATRDLMTAKEVAARLEGELAVLGSRPWSRQIVG